MSDVRLVKPHTHAGTDHPEGAVIDVPADTARWLIEHGVAEKPRKQRSTEANDQARKEG